MNENSKYVKLRLYQVFQRMYVFDSPCYSSSPMDGDDFNAYYLTGAKKIFGTKERGKYDIIIEYLGGTTNRLQLGGVTKLSRIGLHIAEAIENKEGE